LFLTVKIPKIINIKPTTTSALTKKFSGMFNDKPAINKPIRIIVDVWPIPQNAPLKEQLIVRLLRPCFLESLVELLFLGIFTVRNKSIFKQKHIHPHKHSNGTDHTHFHNHNVNHNHGHKSYLIGCIHGIAGSGGLVALIASTMNGFDMMIYFLILFGIGSIIGMTVASGILGLPFILLSKMSSVTKYLRYAIAGISFIIGINIVFTVVLDSKLFL